MEQLLRMWDFWQKLGFSNFSRLCSSRDWVGKKTWNLGATVGAPGSRAVRGQITISVKML